MAVTARGLSEVVTSMGFRTPDLKSRNTQKMANVIIEICGLEELARSNHEAIKLEVMRRTDEYEDSEGTDECEDLPDSGLKKKLDRTKKYTLPLVELLETLRSYQGFSGELVLTPDRHATKEYENREAIFKRISGCLDRLESNRADAVKVFMLYLSSFNRSGDVVYDACAMALTQREYKDQTLQSLQIFWTSADAFSSLFPALIENQFTIAKDEKCIMGYW